MKRSFGWYVHERGFSLTVHIFPAPTNVALYHIFSSSGSSETLNGPFLTIRVMTSYSTSAAAMVVCSALVSYAGATSTISAAIKLSPSRPRMIVLSSRVDQPPVSGVPVAGATVEVNAILQTRSRKTPTRRVQSVDVNTQIYRLSGSNAVPDLLDDSVSANGVDFSCFNNLETAVSVILVVGWAAQCGSDASMNVAVVS
jgi:hypothetical protein